jgi:hypothetical protein
MVGEDEAMTSNGIVQKLWNYCNVLRDDAGYGGRDSG